MPIPPWLQPVDLVGAASRGAQLGLSIRAQDQAAEERAAQLALEGDRINIAQQQHALQWEQANQRAAEALRSHNALEVFRQKNLEERQRQNAILNADRAMSRELDQRRLDLSEANLGLKMTPEERDQEWLDRQKKLHTFTVYNNDLRAAQTAKNAAARALAKFSEDQMNSRMIAAGNAATITKQQSLKDAMAEADAVLGDLKKEGIERGLIESPAAKAPAAGATAPASASLTQATGGVTPPKGTPVYIGDSKFPEGAHIRNKKDNKWYTVKGGVPVPD